MKKLLVAIATAMVLTPTLFSCSKCKECKAATTVKYVYNANSGMTEDEFNAFMPSATVNTDLGKTCNEDLEKIDNKTLTQTASVTSGGMAITTNTTIVYTCE